MPQTDSPLPLNGEALVSFAEAARAAGVPGARGRATINSSTLFRWATRGVPAANGTRVRLEAARIGGRWATSVAAVHRFVATLTAASTSDTASNTALPSTPARRARAARAATAEVASILGS